ncbi:MAG: NUDIX domain-containing protein [Acaryochloridaceae cyanobacterium SU_2_1]|nr:NUDIX domain-containing protein [Acaryochloridaceae cyanobacterium SU_2_1]
MTSTGQGQQESDLEEAEPGQQHINDPAVAIAILYQDQHYLMQLRDDIPGIAYPGHWGFFGGHLDPGETPGAAIQRELWEEIGYHAPTLNLFGLYPDPGVVRHVFYGCLTVSVAQLDLKEGWDLALFSQQDIHASQRYSAKAGGTYPLATTHQKILLDFLKFQAHLQQQ